MLSESAECLQLPSGITISSENFKLERPGKPELRAEILFLNKMLYIWIGSAMIHALNNLQIAYSGTVKIIHFLIVILTPFLEH